MLVYHVYYKIILNIYYVSFHLGSVYFWYRSYLGLVIGPSAVLYIFFVDISTLTNKVIGITWQDLYKLPQRRQDPYPRPILLLVGVPLVFGSEFAYSWMEFNLL